MFRFRDCLEGDLQVGVAFTDSSVDLQGLSPGFAAELPRVEAACGHRFARVHQVHGAEVLEVDEPGPAPGGDVPTADALVTTRRGLGLMIRVADCVPVLLAAPDQGVIAAVHAGRQGMVLNVVDRCVAHMRQRGASRIVAWVGPHVCGDCYEVPDEMRADVVATVPEAWAETRRGTPSLDLGAGVRAQLARNQVEVVMTGGCTREDPGLHSYRRDGAAAGRLAGLVWLS